MDPTDQSLSYTMKRRSGGFSLVEVLISVAILGFVGAGVATLITNTNSVMKESALTEVRDQIAREIEASMQNMALVKKSAVDDPDAGNKSLEKCLSKPKPSEPNKCSIKEQGFVMWAKGGTDRKRRVAGSAANPVYYDKNGALCNQDACRFFRADAYFGATCMASDSRQIVGQCGQARSIYLQFQVVPLKPLASGRMLQPRPINRSQSMITHSISGLLEGQRCPSHASMKGYTMDGRIMCSCMAGAVQQAGSPNDENIVCTLRQDQCRPGEMWLGFETNGAPRCVVLDRECETQKQLDGTNKGIFCGAGGWAEQISMGTCTATEKGNGGKKADEYDVNCPDAAVLCCKEVHKAAP